MKSCFPVIAFALMTLPVLACASCDAVKASIDTRLKANGVSHYRLEVMAADQADTSEGKVIGRCEGSKFIRYSRAPSKVSDDNASGAQRDQIPAPV